MAETARVTLRVGREKSLRRRHPWVFSGAIANIDGSPSPGDTVRIVSADGAFLAHAAFSPASQIRLRVWSFDESDVINAAFLRERIRRSVAMRNALGLMDDVGACRLVFGESDHLPGLVVDRYGRHLVCQFLSAGSERWRDEIVATLAEVLQPEGIHERSDPAARKKEGLHTRQGLLAGSDPPPSLEFETGAGRALVDIAGGQKTGAYLDQRVNRARAAAYVNGRDVLDAYSYAGAFSVACLRGGARHATLIDSSAEALAVARRVAALNGVDADCEFLQGSVPEVLRQFRDAGRQFGLIVLDPPKFVHNERQLRNGCRGYKDINLMAMKLLEPGGVLATFSCSGHVGADLFQKVVAGAAIDADRDMQILERLTQSPDHPVAAEFPEAEYLKGLILRASS
jgi:23S rRNA (cytosine1962-C5)-methyltransferase